MHFSACILFTACLSAGTRKINKNTFICFLHSLVQLWDSGAAVEEFDILELSGKKRAGFVWDAVEMKPI